MKYTCSLFAVLILVTITDYAYSQSQPKWIHEPPKNSFVGIGSDVSLEVAAERSFWNAYNYIIQKRGTIPSPGKLGYSDSSVTIITNNSSHTKLIRIITSEQSVETKDSVIESVVVENRYWEITKTGYNFWTLIRTLNDIASESPPTKFSPVWRSIILPGWGQFYKEQPTKGYIIALSEAVLIPTAIILQNLKSTAEVDAQNSRNSQVLRNYYTDEANTYMNLSTAVYVLAGAIYIYNIVDAIISDGEKIYEDEGQQRSPKINMTANLFPRPQYVISVKLRF